MGFTFTINMGTPLMKRKSTIAFLSDLGITIQQTPKEWVAIYKGKPLMGLAVRHGGESGIKLSYVWRILKEKLKRDGLKEGSKEYEQELRNLKKEALVFI